MSEEITNQDCLDLLKELDALEDSLRSWDVQFVGDCINRGVTRFSEKQKKQLIRMDEEYLQ